MVVPVPLTHVACCAPSDTAKLDVALASARRLCSASSTSSLLIRESSSAVVGFGVDVTTDRVDVSTNITGSSRIKGRHANGPVLQSDIGTRGWLGHMQFSGA